MQRNCGAKNEKRNQTLINPFARPSKSLYSLSGQQTAWQWDVSWSSSVPDSEKPKKQAVVKKKADKLAAQYNLTRVSVDKAWDEAMQLGATYRALTWEALGGVWKEAFQLRERRLIRQQRRVAQRSRMPP